MTKSALDSALRRLRDRGVKLTRPRRAVVELLLESRTHQSADDLLESARRRGLKASRATVYRLVSVLREAGLIEVHDFDQRRRVFEPMVGRIHHDHLFCIKCGRIIEFSSPQIERLQDRILKEHGFRMIYHSHKIFGFCSDCGRRERS